MGRKLIIAMAVLSFAFGGMTFAAVENVKVSGDINTGMITRDLGFGNVTDNDNQFIFSQIKLKIDADLTEGVSAVVSLINERIWGAEAADTANANTELALDLGYVELNEFIYDSLTLILGRQNLRFGNALIIGDPDTNRYASAKTPVELSDLSLRKSFDAVRGIWDFAPWTIDMIFAKIEENTLNRNDDVTLVGANAAYDWSSYNGVTEAYFYSVNHAPDSTAANTSISHQDKVFVLGSRAQADLNDKLTLGLEGAWQFGDSETNQRHLNAFAVQAIAEYRLLDDKNTKLGMNYTYLSGDNGNDVDSASQAWDPLFEDQSPGEVINILFNNTNMQYWKLSASTMPREDITIGLDYIYARLAQDNPVGTTTLSSSLTSAANFGSVTIVGGDGEKEIGHEIDLCGIYDYTEDVQVKLTGGWLIPGNLFDNGNDNIGYSVIGGVSVGF